MILLTETVHTGADFWGWFNQIAVTVSVLLISFFGSRAYGWKRENDRREKVKAWRQARYYKMTGAMHHGILNSLDKEAKDKYQIYFDMRMKEYEENDDPDEDEMKKTNFK